MGIILAKWAPVEVESGGGYKIELRNVGEKNGHSFALKWHKNAFTKKWAWFCPKDMGIILDKWAPVELESVKGGLKLN